MGEFSPWHIAIVLGVMVLLFGSAKLPDLARGLGQSMRILRSETRAMRDDGGAGSSGSSGSSEGSTSSGGSASSGSSASGGSPEASEPRGPASP